GVIDYGSVKPDNIAVDLARLLGSMVEDDDSQWIAGFQAYQNAGVPLSFEEQALSRALDATGTVIGAANWLKWIYLDGRAFEDWAAVGRRFESLVKRLNMHSIV